ncbi:MULTISPECIES: hypothetical protein [Streptomyces]|uniref:Uncharacterized protein n=2 Tax=Streptomyces rimosus subsp. rimosus TaxID=132474 RepID=L8F0A4_STRR1|nr:MULTISPECIES: hypothetical protein [Streptomyces]KOG67259.1 hypothetical protein ADK78_41435 [Kitasatospora aureofaciens]MYT41860.1 hypothetical protein [Streptomyces sp. SID5471]KOT25888.1 hypothetical protein ADK42_40100 [Streptomyces rimosus subsp. rimosus]KOT25933.1 hypothetical protein ADK84_41840 [Streptomyces sp. NRRL WC-3701]KOT66989.1 hypothetical protein ADK47_41485 [Streptomyces rimosus subsp. rimosus]
MRDDPAPAAAQRAVSPLDHRVEAATGHDIDTLWTHRDRSLLDEPHARLVDQHRELAQAETGVTFYRTLLHRLSSGEFPVDGALFERIDRTVDQLEEAADIRDTAARRVLAALEPIEAATATPPAPRREQTSAADRAALLAIAGGAKLYEHLLTGRMAVTTASGTRIPHAELQRLEGAGLVSRDTSHPVHAGQPVVLTEAGCAALTTVHRTAANQVSKTAARPGAWPSTPARRR